MSIQNCIDLVIKIHGVYEKRSIADTTLAQGIAANKIVLETSAIIEPPYLIIRRGDAVFPPHSNDVPMAHFVNLEYLIAEADMDGNVVLMDDVVKRVRDIDTGFMDILCGEYRDFFISTSDIDEGLDDERGAYLLTRSLELEAQMRVGP